MKIHLISVILAIPLMLNSCVSAPPPTATSILEANDRIIKGLAHSDLQL
jgi:PBP1b-binding outer membrane lipoprotein LpoB